MNIVNAIPGEPLPLGRRWEHNATRVVFDISAWVDAFGAGNVRLLHQRQGDAAPYPVSVTRTDDDGTENAVTGTLVLWDVTRADTAQVCHYGRAELRYYSGTEGAEEFLAKSAIYKTAVADALGGAQADAPEEERSWLDELLDAVENVADNVAAAQEAAANVADTIDAAVSEATSAASASATAAAASASDAADDANTAAAAVIAARAAQTAAEEAAQSALDTPSSVLAFTNSAAISISGGSSFTPIINESFSAKAGAVVGVQAQISLSVTATATGSAQTGWTALSPALADMKCRLDNSTDSPVCSQTLDGGSHILRFQCYFDIADTGNHSVKLQLHIGGGSASIAAGAATLLLSGVKEVET